MLLRQLAVLQVLAAPLVLLVPLVPLVLAVLLVPQDLAVLRDLRVPVAVMDTDPDFYNLDISKDGLALIYRSVCFHLEKWPGGHPQEQEALVQLKDNLFRIILEKTLET